MAMDRVNPDPGRPKTISLIRRLSVTYLLVAAPFLVVSAWFIYQRQEALLDRANAQASGEVEKIAGRLRATLMSAEEILHAAALLAGSDAGTCASALRGLGPALAAAQVENAEVRDTEGRLVCGSGQPSPADSRAEPVQSAQSGLAVDIAPDRPDTARAGGSGMLLLRYPVTRPNGAMAGAVLGDLPHSAMAASLAGWHGPQLAGFWLIDDQADQVALGPSTAMPDWSSLLPILRGQGWMESGATFWFAEPVEKRLTAVAEVQPGDYGPRSFARLALPAVILCGLLLTGLAILLVGLTRWVVEPLQTLDRMISGTAVKPDERALADLPDQIYQLGLSYVSRQAEWTRDLQLRQLLVEEVRHRIKNSFQMVLSLLRMQERSISDPQAAAILRSAQERVQALFVVHRMLERDAEDETADARALIWGIAEMLIPSGEDGRISWNADDVESVPLRADQAVIVGLIVNEWLTNSLRHGYAANRGGRISIGLSVRDDVVALLYADDGIGRMDRARAGFGTRLITGLVQQLEGDLAALPGPGSRWELRFRLPKPREETPQSVPVTGDRL